MTEKEVYKQISNTIEFMRNLPDPGYKEIKYYPSNAVLSALDGALNNGSINQAQYDFWISNFGGITHE